MEHWGDNMRDNFKFIGLAIRDFLPLNTFSRTAFLKTLGILITLENFGIWFLRSLGIDFIGSCYMKWLEE